jgi:steroid delta-isomerase-like uncharacterized protein
MHHRPPGGVKALQSGKRRGCFPWTSRAPARILGAVPIPSPELRAAREAIIREHLDSENREDFDATLATFRHPHYELIGTGHIFDGEAEVRRYYAETRTAFPDQRNRLIAMHSADDAVITEIEVSGTHLGPYRGLPPTGRAWTSRMCAVFVFEGDRIVCERVYFDVTAMLRQLGIAHDPLTLKGRLSVALNHPLTVGRAYLGQLLRRGGAGPSGGK